MKSFDNSHLYLLVFPKHDIFKIGKADNVHQRINSLVKHYGPVDYTESYSICLDKSSVFKLERSLHFLYHAHNNPVGSKDGYTELFKIIILPQVIDTINSFIAMNAISSELIKGISIPGKAKQITHPVKRAKKLPIYNTEHQIKKCRQVVLCFKKFIINRNVPYSIDTNVPSNVHIQIHKNITPGFKDKLWHALNIFNDDGSSMLHSLTINTNNNELGIGIRTYEYSNILSDILSPITNRGSDE